jgi:hypothetical protein
MVPSSRHRHVQQLAKRAAWQVYVVQTRKYYWFYYLLAILRHNALSMHHRRAVPVCFGVAAAGGGAESIILSAGSAESIMLSALALRASYTQHRPLSVWYSQRCLAVLLRYANRGGFKKKTIGDTDDCRLRTLVNSASTVPLIGLLPKGAKFCHILNILLVAHQHCHALLRLYFNSSVSGRLVGWSVGRSKIRVPALLGDSLQKDKGSWALGVSLQMDK